MSVPRKSFEPEAVCPLDGVRVIDMSRLVSGNMVSLQLADFGAEVIKIEDPKKGDPLRALQTNGSLPRLAGIRANLMADPSTVGRKSGSAFRRRLRWGILSACRTVAAIGFRAEPFSSR